MSKKLALISLSIILTMVISACDMTISSPGSKPTSEQPNPTQTQETKIPIPTVAPGATPSVTPTPTATTPASPPTPTPTAIPTLVTPPTPSPVILLSPAPGAINVPVRPTFSWTVYPDATKYELQVSLNETFNFIWLARVGDTALSTTSWVSDRELDPNTVYYWRVRPVLNAAGTVFGPYTSSIFTTVRR